jgi:hypothetical protein
VAPRVGKAKDVFGRTELIQEIATNLSDDFRTAPQVVVGDTGSGKTSLLLGLAGHFASKDVVPIVLSLRDAQEIDFAAMAEQRFKEYIDPHVRTAADADKLWRWDVPARPSRRARRRPRPRQGPRHGRRPIQDGRASGARCRPPPQHCRWW